MESLIRVWNRKAQSEEVEAVYGSRFLDLAYGNPFGQWFTEHCFSKGYFSQCYGWLQNTALSRLKIQSFVNKFRIPMQDFEEQNYKSFNDFFIRKFKVGHRVFDLKPKHLPAFCEGRYLAFKKTTDVQKFPVKGEFLTADFLVGRADWAHAFRGGPLLIARLCPTDYHRFHFPDNGHYLASMRMVGDLHSVNPRALRFRPEILGTNERHVSILQTENFGKIAYIEVGALCVGKIVQTSNLLQPFFRGSEKGYFLFGGSTVIVIGQAGLWNPDSDLVEKTQEGIETQVLLGEKLGESL